MKKALVSNYQENQASDYNRISTLADRRLYDHLLHRLLHKPGAGGVAADDDAFYFGDDCKLEFVSGDRSVGCTFKITTGLGFRKLSDADQPDADKPQFLPIRVVAEQNVVANASDPTNPRIDRIFVKPAEVDGDSASKNFINPTTKAVAAATTDTTRAYRYDFAYVAGTPAGAPTAPPPPAGYTASDAIAEFTIEAGAGAFNTALLTDLRTSLVLAPETQDLPGLGAAADFYEDGGGADAYDLSVVGSRPAPQSYIEGMRVRFRPAVASTGGGATLDVAGLGAKSLTLPGGDSPHAGALRDDRDAVARYDAGADAFHLLDASPPAPVIAESSSNVEATVEAALAGSITVPAAGGFLLEVEAEVHAHVESQLGGGQFGEVIATLTEDTGGGATEVRSSSLKVRTGATGDDDKEIDDTIVVKHRFVPTNGTTYTYAVALDLIENGGSGVAELNALDDAGPPVVKRIHSFSMKLIPAA